MPLFKKKNIEQPPEFNAAPPMSGGNTKATYERLNAQIDIDKATIAYKSYYNDIEGSVLKVLKQTYKDEQYDEWRLLNFEADYYCNLFNIESDSQTILWAVQTAKRVAFIYGISGIYKVGNSFMPFYVKKSEMGVYGQFISMEIAPASTILPLQTQFPKDVKITFTLSEDDIANNCAILKWDTLALGAWYKFLPFIKQRKRMLSMLTTEGWNLIKKQSWTVNDPNAFLEELKLFYNTDLPFVITGKSGDEFRNRIEVIESTNTGQTFTQYYEEWENIWYQLLGRRTNSDFKKERNITSEVDASQSNFDILESDNFLHFKSFVSRLETLTGMDFKIKRAEGTYESINILDNND